MCVHIWILYVASVFAVAVEYDDDERSLGRECVWCASNKNNFSIIRQGDTFFFCSTIRRGGVATKLKFSHVYIQETFLYIRLSVYAVCVVLKHLELSIYKVSGALICAVFQRTLYAMGRAAPPCRRGLFSFNKNFIFALKCYMRWWGRCGAVVAVVWNLKFKMTLTFIY